jgi:hypothetical protein
MNKHNDSNTETALDLPLIKQLTSLSFDDLAQMTKNQLLDVTRIHIYPSWTKKAILEQIIDYQLQVLNYLKIHQETLKTFSKGNLCKFKDKPAVYIIVDFDTSFIGSSGFCVIFIMQKLEIKLSEIASSNEKLLYCPISRYAFGDWIQPLSKDAVLRKDCLDNLMKAISQFSVNESGSPKTYGTAEPNSILGYARSLNNPTPDD